jgi:hypothetical protein
MRPEISFTSHPPLDEVWVDEVGRRQGNKDRICQRRQNGNLMRDRNRAVKKKVNITFIATGNDDQDMLSMVPVSDDNISIDSLQQSNYSESEGGIWDNNANDDVGFAPEGANQNLILPDLPVGRPVGQ